MTVGPQPAVEVQRRSLTHPVWPLGRRLAIGVGLASLVLVHYYVLSLPETTTGPLLPIDRLFDVALTLALLLVSGGLGLRILGVVGPPHHSDLERVLFGLALGLGIVAYAVLGIGLLGYLWPPVLSVMLLVAAIALKKDIAELVACVERGAIALGQAARNLHVRSWEGVLAAVTITIVVLTLSRTLTPPYFGDEPGYHLALPAIYVDMHQISLLPMNNGEGRPLMLEMLYAVGLLFGSSIFARLIHFSLAVAVGLLVYEVGRQAESRTTGWLGLVVYVAIPAVPTLAGWAYTDLGSAFYQVLAVVAVLGWMEKGDRRWIVLAGASAGLAMGTKFVGLHLFGILPFIMAASWLRRGHKPLGAFALDLGCFAITAAAVASPWYVKNWLWTGHPLYPVYGGYVLDLATEIAVGQMGGAGDRSRLYFLYAPFDVLINSDKYTLGHAPTVFSALFVLLPVALATGLSRSHRYMLLVAGLLFLLWTQRQQEARLYLTGAILLAIVTGALLTRLKRTLIRHALVGHALAVVIVFAMLATLFDQAETTFVYRPPASMPIFADSFAFLGGFKSRFDYLKDRYPEYAALAFANSKLPAGSRVLFLRSWAGGYYARFSYIQDDFLEPRWLMPAPDGVVYPQKKNKSVGLSVGVAPSLEAAVAATRCLGVTHLFFNKIVLQGASGKMTQADITAQVEGLARMAEEVSLEVTYSDRYAAILEIKVRAECE